MAKSNVAARIFLSIFKTAIFVVLVLLFDLITILFCWYNNEIVIFYCFIIDFCCFRSGGILASTAGLLQRGLGAAGRDGHRPYSNMHRQVPNNAQKAAQKINYSIFTTRPRYTWWHSSRSRTGKYLLSFAPSSVAKAKGVVGSLTQTGNTVFSFSHVL